MGFFNKDLPAIIYRLVILINSQVLSFELDVLGSKYDYGVKPETINFLLPSPKIKETTECLRSIVKAEYW